MVTFEGSCKSPMAGVIRVQAHVEVKKMDERTLGIEDKFMYSGEWLTGNGDALYVATDGDNSAIDFRPNAYTTDANLKYNKKKMRKVMGKDSWKKFTDMLWVDPVILNSTEGKKFMTAYVTRMTTWLRPYRTFTSFTDSPVIFNGNGVIRSALSGFTNGNAWNQWAGVSVKLISMQLTYTMGWQPGDTGREMTSTIYIGQGQTVKQTAPSTTDFWQKLGTQTATIPMTNPLADLKSDIRKDWTEMYRRTTILGGNLEPNMLETVDVYIDCSHLNIVNFGSSSTVLSGDIQMFMVSGAQTNNTSPQFIGNWLIKYITQ